MTTVTDPTTPVVDKRNCYQRKAAVMRKCGAIQPDKTHPAHNFKYISIQAISNHLRQYCTEEGLDVNFDVIEGEVILHLVNVDNPDDRITSRWPVIQGDKAFASTVKFPLMRTFLVGDGEEDATATSSNGSGDSHAAPASSTPARAPDVVKGEPCEQCFDRGIQSKKGQTPHYYTKNDRTECNGWDSAEERYVNHKPGAAPVATATTGDVDPSEIPFLRREDEGPLRRTRCHD